MSCGAVLYMDITDAKTGERVLRQPGPICEEVTGDNACELFSISNTAGLLDLPQRMVRIDVAAWRPEVLANDPVLAATCEPGKVCCPSENLFDLQGAPREDFSPMPAFGRSLYVDLGTEESELTIELSCSQPGQLEDPTACVQEDLLVTALVDDMENLNDRLTEDQARSMAVDAAEPRAEGDGAGGTRYVIETGDRVNLSLNEPVGAIPTFQGFTDRVFDGIACVALDEDVSQAFTLVTCGAVQQPDPNILNVAGHFVPVTTVDEILLALGETKLPDPGLVIGRVVDDTGQVLPGVRVTPVGGGTVQYLNASRTALIGVETSASGYFVSTDAEFGTDWRALHSDGRREDGLYRAGLIQDKVTLLLIRMKEPGSVVGP